MDGEASVKKDWLKQPGLVDSDRLANQSLVGCQTTIQESSNQFESGCFLCGEGSEMNPDQSSVLSNSTNIAYAPPSSSQSAPGFVSSSNTTAAPTAQLLNEDALRLLLWLRGEMIKQTERLTSVVDNFTQIRMDVDYLLRGGTIEPIADYNETLLRNFPLKSVAELDKVEEELLNAAYRRKLFEELRVLGGRDLQDVTRTILRRLFTNGLVKLYNWTGVKNKRPLSQLRLARFIIVNNPRNRSFEASFRRNISLYWTSKQRTNICLNSKCGTEHDEDPFYFKVLSNQR